MALSTMGTYVPRAGCYHAMGASCADWVAGCDGCAIRWAISFAHIAPDARFVHYHGSLVEHHGLYAVAAAVDGRLCLVEVTVGLKGADRVVLRGVGFGSVTDWQYAGRYEAVDADERAARRDARGYYGFGCAGPIAV